MRRLLSLMLAILISGVVFGQIQPINVSKILDQSKEVKTSITQSKAQMGRVQRDNNTIHFANPNKAITGTFSLSPTTYIPGQTMILNFNITFESPDLEFCDGISITFPTGMTPQVTNTSPTIDYATLVTPISGNTVVRGQVSTPSGNGDIYPGSYDFQVAVAIDAGLTGSQSIVCYAMGEGYGSAPHTINQTIIMTEALDNDIAVTNIDLPTSGCDVSATSSITITLQNVGTMAQSDIPVNISINNGTPFTETVAGPIASGATQDYTFTQNFDFSADGVYNITVYSSLSGDGNHNNDTIHRVVNNYAPSPVPITIDFEDVSLHDRYTIIDNNGDGKTMFILNDPTYANSGSYALAYAFSATNPDDYFFSSCIDLTAGQSYKLSLWYRVKSASFPESFEVYLASGPSVADTIGSPIISVSDATNITYEEATANTVTVGSTGSYYIAIRATSDADMWYLYIDDITIMAAQGHDVEMTEILLNNSISTGSTVTPKVIISNEGTSDETVSMQFVINDGTTDVYTSTVTGHAIASGDEDTITFSDWTASTSGNYTATCYFTTTDDNAANDTLTKAFLVSDPIWGFAWNAVDLDGIIPEGPVKVNLATGEIVPIGSNTVTDFMPGADFIRGDWYASNYDTRSLVTIDTITGNLTTIGNLGLIMNGLAYDATTDKLYGCAYDDSANDNSILYEINYHTGTCTQIGTICPSAMIGMAANSHGNIYGINIFDDALYSINKATGAGTVIGPLGYDIRYAQDIAFDRDNDKLYGTLYTTEGLLCEIDTTSGAVTVYTTTSCELTGLAFPYAYTLNDIKKNTTNFNIYPNPANDVLTINSNTTMNQITIINSLGQVVMNVEPNTDFYQININTLPEGIYAVRITTNNGLSTKLIFVAH